MYTITIEKNILSLDDILADAELKTKVLEKYRDINIDYEWYDFIFDDYTERLNNEGFNGVEINFTGFWSQGDGASFTSKYINIDILVTALQNAGKLKYRDMQIIKALYNYNFICDSNVKRYNSHYYHEKSTEFNLYYDLKSSWKHIESIVNNFINIVEQYIYDINCLIYEDLEKTYNYLTSEESIIETLRANDYEFTENGDIYNG